MIWKICHEGLAEYGGLVVYVYSAKPSWQIFHIMETKCISLYIIYLF